MAALRSRVAREEATPDKAREFSKRVMSRVGLGQGARGEPFSKDRFQEVVRGGAEALGERRGAAERDRIPVDEGWDIPRDSRAWRGQQQLDTRKLEVQPTDYNYFPRTTFESAPASVVSEFLDGKNHQVLMDVKSYAQGRHDPNTALGYKRYLASMDLFAEFSAWHTVGRLLNREWLRLSASPPQASATGTR